MPEADALATVRAALDGPVDETYPLTDDETVSTWRARSIDALDALIRRDLIGRTAATGEQLIDALARIAQDPLDVNLGGHPGRTRLVGETVRNVADPGRINQGYKGTCAVTCVETFVAERVPAEYARLVAGLASPGGRVTLSGGDELVRDEDVLEWHDTEARRSPVSRLLQVAFMEFAYPELDYQNLVDGHIAHQLPGEGADDPSENTGTGIGLDEFDRLLEAVSGERWDTVSEHQTQLASKFAALGIDTSLMPDLYRDGMGIIRAALKDGAPIFVTLGSRPDGVRIGEDPMYALPHKVRVQRIDDAEGRAWYDDPLDPEDPWMPGVQTVVEDDKGTCSMSVEDFELLVCEISYQPQYAEGVVPTSGG